MDWDEPLEFSIAVTRSEELEGFGRLEPGSALGVFLATPEPRVLTCGLRSTAESAVELTRIVEQQQVSALYLYARRDKIVSQEVRWWDRATHPLTPPAEGWPHPASELNRIVGRWAGYCALGVWPEGVPMTGAAATALTIAEVHVIEQDAPPSAEAGL